MPKSKLIDPLTISHYADGNLLPFVSFFVGGEPRAKQSFRYSKTGGFTPARVKVWQGEVGWQALMAIRAINRSDPIPKSATIRVTLDFHLGNKRRIDLDNLSKAVLDGLNGIVWVDDQQVTQLTITKSASSKKPGVQVCVYISEYNWSVI